jgi:hypothetical protein
LPDSSRDGAKRTSRENRQKLTIDTADREARESVKANEEATRVLEETLTGFAAWQEASELRVLETELQREAGSSSVEDWTATLEGRVETCRTALNVCKIGTQWVG